MSVILDRTFLTDLQQGRADAVSTLDELVDAGVPLVVPAVALPTILARSAAPHDDVKRIREATEVVSFTLEDARAAAANLRSRSRAFPVADPTALLVEATAVGRPRLPVVTRAPHRYERCRTRTY